MIYIRLISRVQLNKNLHASNIFIYASMAIILFAILVAHPATVRAAGDLGTSRDLESALLLENWQQVINLIDAAKEQPFGPVLRLLKGHACLASNQNNQSMRLFLSVYQPKDLKAWQAWASQFVGQHGDKAVTYYFLGDARCRLREWDKALEAFNHALKLRPRHALVLNARGAVYAAQGQWDRALLDFDAAALLAPALADAHASLGALWIQRRTGVDGAMAAFNQALKLNPDFALALNGRGCAYLARGELEKAYRDLKSAYEKANYSNIPVINLVEFAKMKDEFTVSGGKSTAQVKPGMSTEAIIKDVKPLSSKTTRQLYVQARNNKELNNFFGKIGSYLGNYIGVLGPYFDKDKPYVVIYVNGKTVSCSLPPEILEWLRKGLIIEPPPEIPDNTIITYVFRSAGVPVYAVQVSPNGKIIRQGTPAEIKTPVALFARNKGGGGRLPSHQDPPKGGQGGHKPRPTPVPGGTPKPGGGPKPPAPPFPTPGEGPVWGPAPGGGVSPPDNKPPQFPYPPGIGKPPYPWPPNPFGHKLAQDCRQEEQFWSTVLATVIQVKPEAAKIAPGGITAEDLRHAYVDRGQWLNTVYGLNYAVAPAKNSPPGTRLKP